MYKPVLRAACNPKTTPLDSNTRFKTLICLICDQNGQSTVTHCKKRFAIFPARENLVSDIPAGDGKIAKLFFTVHGGLHVVKGLYLLTEAK
jgi:hypothetical protein